MDWFSGIVVYLLAWWMCLFVVLPWNLQHKVPQNQDELKKGIAGAPISPQLKKKFIITTGLSVLIWLVVFTAVEMNLINFRDIAQDMKYQDSRPIN